MLPDNLLKIACISRVRFGSNNLFIFFHPPEAAELKKRGKTLRDITYEYAIEEIAKHSGFNFEEGTFMYRGAGGRACMCV